MSVRRLHSEQPNSFAFTAENAMWAEKQLEKFPEGRQASAVIPLLWRAQEQHEGWLTEPAIRYIADMLDMAYIRVLEVATFYTMFQLQPVGKKAHIQVCGTTPCMLRGSNDIKAVCKKRIAENPHELSADGNFSWEEVECLGACVNAPMVQIFKDTYEDLTPETFEAMLDAIDAGKEITPGPQNGRHFSVPLDGRTSLAEDARDYGPAGDVPFAQVVNGSEPVSHVFAGVSINGGAQPEKADGLPAKAKAKPAKKAAAKPKAEAAKPAAEKPAAKKATPKKAAAPVAEAPVSDDMKPNVLDAPEGGKADDLTKIKGVGPKINGILHGLGIFHFHQIAAWDDANKAWVDDHLSFKGRIDREQWIPQAAELAKKSEG